MDKSEMRLDPLTQGWTIFSEARASRPAFGSVRKAAAAAPTPDPFAAGAEKFAPRTLLSAPPAPSPWAVRVVPNRVPIFQVEGDHTRHADGFYDRMDGVGAHEIIVEAPGEEALEQLDLPGISRVLSAWKARMLDLLRDSRLRSFAIVKNVGVPAGGQLSHSVSQLIAMAIIFPALETRLRVARQFYAIKKRSIFEDILMEEVRTASRIVYENNGFTVFCPYASRTPFELAIYPKRQVADFHGVTDQETAQLADGLRAALQRLNAALDHPPYNLTLFTAPSRTPRGDHWSTIEKDFRWHIEILPRLHHLGGLELGTGCWINPVKPETAAEHMRSVTTE